MQIMEQQNQKLPENQGNQLIIGNGNWFNFIKQIKGDDGKINFKKLLELLGAIASIIALVIAFLEIFGVINIIK